MDFKKKKLKKTLEERKGDAPDSLIDPPWSSSVAVEVVQGSRQGNSHGFPVRIQRP